MARQRGNKWQADGRAFGLGRKTFDSREAAEAWEAAVNGGIVPVTAHTLGPYVSERFEYIWGIHAEKGEAKSRKYIEGNWRIIYQFIPETTELAKITKPVIDQMVIDMRKSGKKGSTINRKVANLNRLLKDAYSQKAILVLPELKGRQPEGNARERVLTVEEERKALLWFEHTGREASGALFQFLLYTGCRIGEALSLDRKHVTPTSVTFHHTKVKNGRTRTIPLVPKAKEAWDVVAKRSNRSTPFGDLMPYHTFRDHWAALAEHLKVDDPEFVPHMLRHTCATRLVTKDVALPRVMKWMGHRSMQMTMRYTHLVPHDLDVAAMALS